MDLPLEAIVLHVSLMTVCLSSHPEHLPLKVVQFLNVSLCMIPRTEPQMY